MRLEGKSVTKTQLIWQVSKEDRTGDTTHIGPYDHIGPCPLMQ